jgi:hypothetical protein
LRQVWAERVLEAVADGRPVRATDTAALAEAVLAEPRFVLAAQVLEGGPYALDRAMELARLVRGGAEVGTDVAESAS